MRHALLISLLLPQLLTPSAAQDLEPNLRRAVQRLVGEIALDLNGRSPAPSGLAIRRGRVGDAALGALTRSLLDAGFKVRHLDSLESAGEDLEVLVEEEAAPPNRRLVLHVGGARGRRLACRFGAAEWVDAEITRPGGHRLMVVSGSLESTRSEAVASATQKAWEGVCGQLGLPRARVAEPSELDSFRTRLFVGERSNEGRLFYRAIIGVEMDEPTLVSLRGKETERQEAVAWSRLVRTAGGIAWGIAMILGYLYADLRTRGYWTSALRVLFGSLMVIGCAALWGMLP